MTSVRRSTARPGWKPAAEAVLKAPWSICRPQYANRIIYYHSVHPALDLSHRCDAFPRQLEWWLKEHGYHDVRVSQPSDRAALREPWVAITLDDGYRANLEGAVPMLHDVALTATFLVVAGMVRDGKRATSDERHKLYPGRQVLSTSEVHAWARSGFDIGSHNFGHRMSSKVSRRSQREFSEGLRASTTILEEITGKSVTAFAYPNGQKGAFPRHASSAPGCRVAARSNDNVGIRAEDVQSAQVAQLRSGRR